MISIFPSYIIDFLIKKIDNLIIEDKINGLDKRNLFNYLISNRIFIDSLTDYEIKYYFKYLKKYRRTRFINKLKNFFHLHN